MFYRGELSESVDDGSQEFNEERSALHLQLVTEYEEVLLEHLAPFSFVATICEEELGFLEIVVELDDKSPEIEEVVDGERFHLPSVVDVVDPLDDGIPESGFEAGEILLACENFPAIGECLCSSFIADIGAEHAVAVDGEEVSLSVVCVDEIHEEVSESLEEERSLVVLRIDIKEVVFLAHTTRVVNISN